jgi:hypothetical protein
MFFHSTGVSLVVRLADWSPEITGVGRAATSRFIPLPAERHKNASAQALLLYTARWGTANPFSMPPCYFFDKYDVLFLK